MNPILTKDGSKTLYSRLFKDVFHSVSGAIEEARGKFVEPAKIKEYAEKGEVRILDVCFGIGYNSLMAIHEALKVNPRCRIRIVGLENDKEVIKQISEMKFEGELKEEYKIIQKAAEDCLNGRANKGNVKVDIILGDARETIDDLKERFDAVFLDPFTPKKAPELWTKEFIGHIREKMKEDAILATYSCARMVRDNLKSAGFNVHDGPSVGRLAPSTYATIK